MKGVWFPDDLWSLHTYLKLLASRLFIFSLNILLKLLEVLGFLLLVAESNTN